MTETNEKRRPEVVGRAKCPICGTSCEVRANKNQILYTMCPMGHQSKMASFDSKEARAVLAQGRQYSNGVINLYPKERKDTENGHTNERTDDRRRDNCGNTTITGTGDTRTGQPGEWWQF